MDAQHEFPSENGMLYDPPGGWRYGFPKPYRPCPADTIEETLLRDGYPQREIDNGGARHVRFIGDGAREVAAGVSAVVVAPANDNGQNTTPGKAPTDRKGDWMQLSDGTAFWPLDPRSSEISIESIAHALGMIVRYCGHVHTFYSVGEHSVHLCRWVHAHGGTTDEQLWALLHDAPESKGLTDIIRPVKPYIVGYKPLESAVMDAVCDRFGLPCEMPAIVHEADGRILHDEKAQAMGPPPYDWSLVGKGLGVRLEFWSPAEAKAAFLAEFWRIVETGRP